MDDLSERVLNEYRSGKKDFRGRHLSGLRIARQEMQGADFTDCVFNDCILAAADFTGSNFTGATFEKCNSIAAIFIDCNFTGATLENSAFGKTDFFQALFHGTLLSANFRETFFVHSKWRKARLLGSRFNGAIFGFNDIHECVISASSFAEVRVVGFCDVDAKTASMSITMALLSMRELARRQNDEEVAAAQDAMNESFESTLTFFVRAGVAREDLRSYLGGEWRLPDDYADAFISYSSEDHDFAQGLSLQLRAAGISTWFAPHDMRGGRKIADQISEAISQRQKMILVLSDSSMSSNWVATELRRALKEERESGKKKLFPIRLVDYKRIEQWSLFDSDLGDDLARLVREYYILDFSHWRDTLAFGEATTRLIGDLRP